MWKAEGIFAEGKTFHGLSRARYRGTWKVQIQVYVIASVQNLKRLLAFGRGDLISNFFDLAKNVIQKIFFEKFQFFFAAHF